ncbi:MAG: hypothetical protein ABW277_24390 [Longimicrobiaceae bacterium]
MTGKLLLPVALATLYGGAALAQNCSDVIALSREVRTTSFNQAEFQVQAAAFCNEYSSTNTGAKSQSFNLAYEALSGMFGSSKSSQAAVATRVCSTNDLKTARADAYSSYLSSVDERAYKAYEQCIALGQEGVRFQNPSMLAGEFFISTSFTSSSSTTRADLLATPSDGIQCTWEGVGGTRRILINGQTADLRCRKSQPTKGGVVRITNQTSGRPNQTLALNWGAHDADGLPLDLLAQVRSRYEQLLTALRTSVVAFADEKCPPEWEPYEPAFGRFVRGLDPTRQVDPDTTRAVGSLQGFAVGKHAHAYAQPERRDRNPVGANNYCSPMSNWHLCHYWTGNAAGEANTPTQENGGPSESRPVNVALLYCRQRS